MDDEAYTDAMTCPDTPEDEDEDEVHPLDAPATPDNEEYPHDAPATPGNEEYITYASDVENMEELEFSTPPSTPRTTPCTTPCTTPRKSPVKMGDLSQ